jgi:predicted phosphodiesterase
MKYAVVSDIHANVEAFEAVLARIDAHSVDQIVCLGDIVGYFANPNECVAIMRDRGAWCIAGNHDRVAAGVKAPTRFSETARRAIAWTSDRLTTENVEFLRSLKLIDVVDDRFLIVHGALHPEPNDDVYLSSVDAVRESCRVLVQHPSNAKICFFGQTHCKAAYAADQYGRGAIVEVNHDSFSVRRDTCYLVNPGSVGQPRDGNPRASFLIYDAGAGTIEFHRVAYDLATCHDKARRAGLLAKETGLRARRSRIVATIHSAMERVMRA